MRLYLTFAQDAQARIIVPRLPVLKRHVRMVQHLRGLLALFTPEGISCLRTYDSLVQAARYSEQEPTEAEFKVGMQTYQQLLEM